MHFGLARRACLALLVARAVAAVEALTRDSGNRTFVISGDAFLKDGAPFQVLSGSVHYFRHRPEDVQSRLRKARLCGLNAVQTYIHWALHEPTRGAFARLDELTGFLAAAQAEGLLVVLRPGPYICGETQGGGLPGWLQEARGGAGPGGALLPRSADAAFLAAVDAWFAVLLPLLAPYLYSAGGPVIMAQVGNEEGYWSADASANPYLAHVRGALEAAWGAGAVVVHTTDSALPALLHGGVPANYATFATVDFGPGDNATAAFAAQRAANGGGGPAFNSELYIGGMNAAWGGEAYANDTAAARNASLAAYEALIRSGASLSLYMFSGGTNWALEAGLHADGAASWQTGPYVPGGPLSEAGDFTDLGVGVCAVLGGPATDELRGHAARHARRRAGRAVLELRQRPAHFQGRVGAPRGLPRSGAARGRGRGRRRLPRHAGSLATGERGMLRRRLWAAVAGPLRPARNGLGLGRARPPPRGRGYGRAAAALGGAVGRARRRRVRRRAGPHDEHVLGRRRDRGRLPRGRGRRRARRGLRF